VFEKNEIEAALDAEIIQVLASMKDDDKETEEYTKKVASFEKLYELRHKSRISNETIATIAANFLGLVVIMNHERAHVIASKAFGLIKKII
jgi:hypothetical protein